MLTAIYKKTDISRKRQNKYWSYTKYQKRRAHGDQIQYLIKKTNKKIQRNCRCFLRMHNSTYLSANWRILYILSISKNQEIKKSKHKLEKSKLKRYACTLFMTDKEKAKSYDYNIFVFFKLQYIYFI